jgi:hypothetical protein
MSVSAAAVAVPVPALLVRVSVMVVMAAAAVRMPVAVVAAAAAVRVPVAAVVEDVDADEVDDEAEHRNGLRKGFYSIKTVEICVRIKILIVQYKLIIF